MECGEKQYIWQHEEWPAMRYDLPSLARVSRAQGLLLGRLVDAGMPLREQASLEVLTADVLKTSEIEGEQFDPASVRSSIARRLGVDIGALAPVDRHVEGVVDMILDAASNAGQPLTVKRLCAWHAALFPTGRSGLADIRTGMWRDDAARPMQVVSGPLHRHRVHFEAPAAASVDAEVATFLAWFNADTPEPMLLKAGLAHLWFVTLHPFDDGNGRIARAVADLLLARADGTPQRFYSLSAQIQRERSDYYEKLERTQKGGLDVSDWLHWFLGALERAIAAANLTLDEVLAKSGFWQQWGTRGLNERQVKILNRLLDGFEGKLTSSKWAAITKCSPDTALRDIKQLLDLGVLRRSPGGGRSTAYELTR